ncbi:MAG: PKD domain-containing protein, partial [Gammaproteobacteria bacterium]|nr:PKD domain-containing protein [Gammaproteobacteria bacterium]
MLICLAALSLSPLASGEPPADYVHRARVMHADELDIERPGGLAWSRRADSVLVLPAANFRARTHSNLIALDKRERRGGQRRIAAAIGNPRNLDFDNKAHRLLLYDTVGGDLIEVAAGRDGLPDPATLTRTSVRGGITDAQGLTVDPVTGRVFLLDSAGPRLVILTPEADGGLGQATVETILLDDFAPGQLRGMAFDPGRGNLHVLAPAEGRLYEISDTGTIMVNRDLAGLRDPQGLVMAPSSDSTDNPDQLSLYVAEAGVPTTGLAGRISEFSFTAGTQQAMVTTATATLVQHIHTSAYTPPSPDAMGIAYVDATDMLVMSDSEVNEIPSLFTGDNIFEIDYMNGSLLGTASTLDPISYSAEPVGVAYDPGNGLLFISHDDNGGKYFVIDAGTDGFFFTSDDDVIEVATGGWGNGDPEGITFDRNQGLLYTADGVDSEVYEIDPGPNGIFGDGDDVTSNSFDTQSLGATDPEAITFDPISGNLYILGNPADTVFEVTTSGTLVRTIDITAADPPNPSGLAYGPRSDDPSSFSLYITDRGVDNNSDPNENDGQLFEVSFASSTPGNVPPVVNAGPDLSVTLPASASLDGTITDDPQQTLSILWLAVSGPGSVTFGTPTAADTTASFSAPGTYVVRLTANDGELSGADETTVTVTGVGGSDVLDIQVAAASDDAEERASGSMYLTSTDLELVFDKDIQTVGMRFTGVTVPPGASISNAWIQFTVDETDSETTNLTIRGQAEPNPGTFTSTAGNISGRPVTGTSQLWSPPPWTNAGDAGAAQRTPDIAHIIAEITALPGWSSGNALVIIITGTGVRTAESFNGSAPDAPRLHVEYTTQSNDPPTVVIDAPSPGSSFDEGVSVAFGGTANDTEDGDLTTSLAWTSDLDGQIGIGGSFSRSDLMPGLHTITATATDNAGASGSDQITLTVVPNTPPTIGITSPATGTTINEGDAVTLSGTASDAEDGNLSASISWNSDRDGGLGTGASIVASGLSAGIHIITASVSDSGGLAASDTISLTVVPNTPPTIGITSPATGTTINEGDAVTLSGTASDAEDGNLSASISWNSDRDGGLGTGASIVASGLSAGIHIITASVSDSGGLAASDTI